MDSPVDIFRFKRLFHEYEPIQEWIREHLQELLYEISDSEPEIQKQFHRYLIPRDKNLRRNQRHEHHSYLFQCDHCGFEDDIRIGTNSAEQMIFDETVEKIKSGFYGEKWKALFESHPKTLVNIFRTLYVCPSCGHYESDYNLGLYVLKDDLTEEEIDLAGQDPNEDKAQYVYLYGMSWPLQYYRKIGSFVHRCPECGKRMHEGGFRDKPRCPKCGKEGSIQPGRVIWG